MSENNGNDMLSQLLKEVADPAVVIPTVTPTDETARHSTRTMKF